MTKSGSWHKVSLHSSGQVHSAVTKEKAKGFGMTPEQRLAVKWDKSLKMNDCGVMFNIIFPYSELYDTEEHPSFARTMHIPLPENKVATVVTFIKTKTNSEQFEVFAESSFEVIPVHTVRVDTENYLTVCYYYTDEYDDVIESAHDKFKEFIKETPPPKEPLKLASGFVTITGKSETPYYIGFRII
jgi:hypothetical protein